MDILSPRHLLVLLVIVLLVFGTKKVKTLGSDLGHAFRGFKDAMKDGENAASDEAAAPKEAKQIPTPEKPAENSTEKVAQKPAATEDKVTHA